MMTATALVSALNISSNHARYKTPVNGRFLLTHPAIFNFKFIGAVVAA